MKILQSHAIYTEKGIVDGYLVMDGNTIQMITDDVHQLPKGEITRYGNQRIIPGIIDVHSHGYRSYAARTLVKEEVLGLCEVLPSIGVTGTLPTVCGWKGHQLEMFEAVSDAILSQTHGTRMLGIHMEGPFFHPIRHNATPLSELVEPSIAECEECFRASKGLLKYLTMAPELPHAMEVIKWLSDHDVIVGGGHTTADEAIYQEAKQHGMKVSIHTGNAMNQMDRRNVNFMGAALLDPDMYCEIICDLIHVSKEMLEVMFRIKQNDERFLMISDSDTVSGVEPGYYLVGNQRTRVTEDGHMLLDDGTIAGSCRNVLYGIRNLVEELHLPLATVIKMSSLNPARILGVDHQKGSLFVGKDADIVVIDDQYQVIDTYVEGRLEYHQGDTLPWNPRFDEDVPRIQE